jgi:hypothetical protein
MNSATAIWIGSAEWPQGRIDSASSSHSRDGANPPRSDCILFVYMEVSVFTVKSILQKIDLILYTEPHLTVLLADV